MRRTAERPSLALLPCAPALVRWRAPLAVACALAAWGAWGALAAAPEAGVVRVPPLLALALCARLVAWGLEAGFYRMAWCAAGARLPGPPLIAAIAACSLCDLVASMLRAAPAWPDGPWGALVVGRPPATGGGTPALATAGFGLTAVARIVGTALAQASALRRPLAAPLALTLGAWLASRVALVLAAALVRGRSPW